MPTYQTFGAIHHDTKDITDGKSYYYASFIMDNKVLMVKINADTLKIVYTR